MTVARNAPCPCGSGKKYKRCHGADGAEEPSAVKKRVQKLPLLIAVGGLNAGVIHAFTVGFDTGGLVAVGGVVAAIALSVFSDPPPPNANPGDPAGLGFGR